MPKDGTVHQLTSNVIICLPVLLLCYAFQTMLFLERLLEQMDVAGAILAEQGKAKQYVNS